MALLTFTHVPEYDQMLGPSQRLRGYQVQPGNSDYAVGGYVIKASDVGFGKAIFGAKIAALNGAAQSYIWIFQPPTTYFGANPTPQSTINLMCMKVNTITGLLTEVAALTNLSSCYIVFEALGY